MFVRFVPPMLAAAAAALFLAAVAVPATCGLAIVAGFAAGGAAGIDGAPPHMSNSPNIIIVRLPA